MNRYLGILIYVFSSEPGKDVEAGALPTARTHYMTMITAKVPT